MAVWSLDLALKDCIELTVKKQSAMRAEDNTRDERGRVNQNQM